MSFINPIENGYLTSSFGTRKVNRNDGKGWVDDWHQGVDLSRQPNSKVPVRASSDGVVIRVQTMTGYGKIVIIKHDVGGVHYETNYAHLASQSVTKGQEVKQGQIIGIMGKTGGNWPIHLHFEIHKGPWVSGQKNAVDPARYIKFYSKGELVKMEAELKKAQETINKQTEEIEQLKKDVRTIKDDVAKVFNNPEDASDYAGGALKFMKDLGLYKGNTTGNLLAKSAITRQDLAMVFKSYHELSRK